MRHRYRQRYKQVNIRAVKNWARQILRGLVYLHGHNPPVIHRDLKCDNIFVNGHLGQVKIGDLGLAAILRGSQPAHSVIGTPEFMAPELYEEEYNELVDIYSFGMCVLEMLTSEYPYSECSNPAQIYKKVTSGKLPDAFYRIHDLEAQQFIGKCLETASKRMSAKQLLLDPFLASHEEEMLPAPRITDHKSITKNPAPEYSHVYLPTPLATPRKTTTDMKITGKMNPEDDTIFLKVQIADKEGCVRNIYFPFDILSDTPVDVATEMVKELEITDREPFEIAEVIENEISALVPHWKEPEPEPHPHQTFSYQDDDDDDGPHHAFCSFSSCSSSHASLSGLISSTHISRGEGTFNGCDWLQGDLFADDDASSQSSAHSQSSGMYSNINYNSGSEHDFNPSPRRRDYCSAAMSHHQSTRFCPEEKARAGHSIGMNRQSRRASSSNESGRVDNRQLTRNRSLVDVRSQLLHRTLVEEVNKRRLFKTVGDVESIGFQSPKGLCEKGSPLKGKKQGFKW
uniref:non-specific serine/threonine protein kinase n=1 Tax=Nelumbo nucifera TaxID=4432 RepID=A0A822Y1F3_NELNU|nr:TPA_asm: hypothetical protein HUJ06_027281 [Nelumbo nucifera]